MNSVIFLGIMCFIAWLLSAYFGMIQIKNFNKNYIEMRKKGKVVIGKQKGAFKAGTVVLIGIDENEVITETRKIQGVTIFSRVKPFKGLQEEKMEELSLEHLSNYNKLLQEAIMDGIQNYRDYKLQEKGEIVNG